MANTGATATVPEMTRAEHDSSANVTLKKSGVYGWDAAGMNWAKLAVNSDGELLINLEVSDIEIGAVELKNATDDTRASVTTRGAKGAVAVEVLDGSGNQITAFGGAAAQYALQYDDVGGGVAYVGEANPGSATSSASWRIKRITTLGLDVTTEWADGDTDFDNVYDDRAILTYS
jgi:hypothetical protein